MKFLIETFPQKIIELRVRKSKFWFCCIRWSKSNLSELHFAYMEIIIIVFIISTLLEYQD